jgi:hypothetical protein
VYSGLPACKTNYIAVTENTWSIEAGFEELNKNMGMGYD